MTKPGVKDLLDMTSRIVAAYAGRNDIPAKDLPDLIDTVFAKMQALADPGAAGEGPALEPAVPIDESVTDEFIYSLEDGQPYKSLKRHLRSRYGMSPEDYREKWGLPPDYPMVAPAYARERSRLAKTSGLGRQTS